MIEIAGHKQIARVPVNARTLCGGGHAGRQVGFRGQPLPLDRADGEDVAANVSVIDAATHQVTILRLPNGSSSVRGMSISPDGRYVYVVHVLSHYQLPATQLEPADQHQRHEHH